MSDERLVSLPLSKIRIDGDTQPRLDMYREIVDAYRREMRKGAHFPPVKVVFDGANYWLYDGFHRLRAARLAHRKVIKAIVHKGSREDAVWRCLGANAVHGLRRSREDTTWAITRAIKICPNMSNRFIARHVGVDHNTVSRRRKELESTGEIHQLARLCGADGRWRAANRGCSYATMPMGEFFRMQRHTSWRFSNGKFARWDPLRPLPEYDCTGRRLCEMARGMVTVFDCRPAMLRMAKQAQRLQEDITMSPERASGLFWSFDWQRTDELVDELVNSLRQMVPHAVCRRCKGAGCEMCGRRGWVSREKVNEILPLFEPSAELPVAV